MDGEPVQVDDLAGEGLDVLAQYLHHFGEFVVITRGSTSVEWVMERIMAVNTYED